MATLGFAETPLRQHELTDGTENHSLECLPPPLAPIGTTASRNAEVVLRKRAVYAHEDDLLNRPEQNDLSGSRTSFSLRRKLAAGTAIVAALGVCAYAYFLLAPPNDKTGPQSAEVSAAVQPAPATVQTALNASGSSAEPDGSKSASSRTEALPAEPVDASRKAEPVEASQKVEPVEASQKARPLGVSQKIVSAPSATTTEARISVAAGAEDVLFLQRPGVNIRSTPSRSGGALGTAPKGTRFKVLSREADWIQVQNGRLKGWINAQFLAPTEPR